MMVMKMVAMMKEMAVVVMVLKMDVLMMMMMKVEFVLIMKILQCCWRRVCGGDNEEDGGCGDDDEDQDCNGDDNDEVDGCDAEGKFVMMMELW